MTSPRRRPLVWGASGGQSATGNSEGQSEKSRAPPLEPKGAELETQGSPATLRTARVQKWITKKKRKKKTLAERFSEGSHFALKNVGNVPARNWCLRRS